MAGIRPFPQLLPGTGTVPGTGLKALNGGFTGCAFPQKKTVAGMAVVK